MSDTIEPLGKEIPVEDMQKIVNANEKLVKEMKMLTDTPLTDDEEIIINGDYNRYVYSGFAREMERLKIEWRKLTEMLIEVRDNPNNNVFENLHSERCND